MKWTQGLSWIDDQPRVLVYSFARYRSHFAEDHIRSATFYTYTGLPPDLRLSTFLERAGDHHRILGMFSVGA